MCYKGLRDLGIEGFRNWEIIRSLKSCHAGKRSENCARQYLRNYKKD